MELIAERETLLTNLKKNVSELVGNMLRKSVIYHYSVTLLHGYSSLSVL